jgi:hypothetical protein
VPHELPLHVQGAPAVASERETMHFQGVPKKKKKEEAAG